MKYQKENSLILTGNAMITKPNYVVTLCFQIENGTRKGKSCDISITKNQLEMLHRSLTAYFECMMETPKEQEDAQIEIQKIMQEIMEEISTEEFKLINPEGE